MQTQTEKTGNAPRGFGRDERQVFKVQMFRDDMGSYTTTAHSWENLLWDVNSARDHDGLPHLTLEQLKNCNPEIKKSLIP